MCKAPSLPAFIATVETNFYQDQHWELAETNSGTFHIPSESEGSLVQPWGYSGSV